MTELIPLGQLTMNRPCRINGRVYVKEPSGAKPAHYNGDRNVWEMLPGKPHEQFPDDTMVDPLPDHPDSTLEHDPESQVSVGNE